MAIARFPVVTIDCPDPGELARFYGAILDWAVNVDDDGSWADIRKPDNTTMMNFQRVADYQPPDWPGQGGPQQMHLDVDVDDLDEGEVAVIERGGVKHDHQPGTTFRVFLDPAGHPFCLCLP